MGKPNTLISKKLITTQKISELGNIAIHIRKQLKKSYQQIMTILLGSKIIAVPHKRDSFPLANKMILKMTMTTIVRF